MLKICCIIDQNKSILILTSYSFVGREGRLVGSSNTTGFISLTADTLPGSAGNGDAPPVTSVLTLSVVADGGSSFAVSAEVGRG